MGIIDAKAMFVNRSMSFFYSMVLVLVVLALSSCSSGDDPAPTPPVPEPDTTTPAPPEPSDRTFDFNITSEITSEVYPLKIFVPAEFETNKNLPAIYLLHGLNFYESLKQKTKEIDFPAIIVALGDKVNVDTQVDFFPSYCGDRSNEGFENFYNLLTKQVVPLVDENYENDSSSRSLIGYGTGGVFVLAALLLENPEDVLFRGAISVDMGIYCGAGSFEDALNTMDDRISTTDSNETFKFYSTVAGVSEPRAFEEYLESKVTELPWFEFDFMNFENEDGDTVVGPSFKVGLKYIYEID